MKQLTLLGSALPFALLALSACAEPIEDRPEAEETMIPVEPDGGIGDGAEPLPDVVEENRIPDRFHGSWDASAEDCSSRSDMRLEIAGDRIRFHESTGEVTSVAIDGPSTIRVAMTVSGEGETAETARAYALSDDGQTLTSSAGDGEQFEPFDLVRCQA
ncbi:hypothetical protein K3152_08100 [Qipengyuania sp. 1NDH17]|uniref:C-type lysozyme inhibitor domain-containing protein n=1 Tax=Qipengyuania polymorpha TaxID=2867234 RepID=A0ABS7J0W6_9SPHN|nr:hypothetical protein [Qipengyuania polymorpha]MBX7458205.1 hypothetical protein [Qipengyuania polymorpha]